MSIYSLPFFSNSKTTPLDFDSYNNLNLWLDAADPYGDGTFLSSNTSLGSWKDKSKYKNHATALPHNSEVATTISYDRYGFNSIYPTFQFTGERKRFAGSFVNSPTVGNSIITGKKMRVFVVGTVNNNGSSSVARFIGFSNAYKGRDFDREDSWGFLRQSAQGMGPFRGYQYVTNNPSAYQLALIWEAWFDGTKANASFLNGDSTVSPSNSNTPNQANFDINFYAVGNNTDPTDAPSTLHGNISEILVYNTDLTSFQVEKIEGYLAWKWGLQGTLKTGHPYKGSAP
jgi:hypothetical protein